MWDIALLAECHLETWFCTVKMGWTTSVETAKPVNKEDEMSHILLLTKRLA